MHRLFVMSLAKRLIAVAAAALQLTLPLAAYARTPFVPGADDICSVSRAADHHRGNAPAGKHLTHCALCAHGAPPALTARPRAQVPLTQPPAARVSVAAFELPQPAHARANARAPPAVAVLPT